MGAFLVGRERVPAVLKRSPLGLQFFACAPGHGGFSEPESAEHQMAKVALVKGLSAAGVPASVERPGYSPLGEEWVADVFAQTSRSEEHTSELQSLMRISYAVFCLKKKKINIYMLSHQSPQSILSVTSPS